LAPEWTNKSLLEERGMLERFLALLGISEQKDEDLFEEESGEEGSI